jgi:hypothetical protein
LLVMSTLFIPLIIIIQPSSAQASPQKEKNDLTFIFVQLHTNREMGKLLLQNALMKLKTMYPNFDVN